ncbi:sensor histidine kinase [Halobacillus sp. BAB-2008]|uniref:sensor histidine kinase n=1 Tax=Halobacillus sp. BAB-2008 TaxID=1246484 RepID=UPI0002A4FCC9|nr:sensor histidine kinase [Halobacillus sp. BAB-2008]ELK48126.1 two-component sensor histidine kinase [Halobacillus sp. BAB-2008]
MIGAFLKERLAWIAFLFGLQVLAALVGAIDSTIPVTSVLYYNFLSFLLIALFLFIRYQKETRFYRQMQERDRDLDLSTFPEGDSPFERIIDDNVTDHMERLKQELADNQHRLEEEKDQLLSWIHEVKTPMSAMHLLFDKIEDYKLKSQLTYEWMRIHLLLDQQLYQKRIPFIENDLYIEEIELEPLLFQEIRTLKSWCMQKGIGFDIDLEATHVLSDAKWLAFILRQLLTNAIKYSESSDITITSRREDERVHIAIRDEGRGIEAKDLPRIFDKGFTSTSDHQNGAATGMGLYLTDRIRKTLKMKISVTSEVGQGSTFTLHFPKKDAFTTIRSM